jgi:hypothetical protein
VAVVLKRMLFFTAQTGIERLSKEVTTGRRTRERAATVVCEQG